MTSSLLKKETLPFISGCFLVDILGLVLAAERGRAKKFNLLLVLQKISSYSAASNVRLYFQWTPSELDVMDNGLRGVDIPGMAYNLHTSMPQPFWFKTIQSPEDSYLAMRPILHLLPLLTYCATGCSDDEKGAPPSWDSAICDDYSSLLQGAVSSADRQEIADFYAAGTSLETIQPPTTQGVGPEDDAEGNIESSDEELMPDAPKEVVIRNNSLDISLIRRMAGVPPQSFLEKRALRHSKTRNS